MPTYDFVCEVCGTPGREWRPEGKPPRFCGKYCTDRGKFSRNPYRIKWPITPEMHAMIEGVYKRSTGDGEVNALARRFGYPRWKITRYATQQGWIAQQRKEPNWTEEEITILERHGHRTPERIQLRLKAAGFPRSAIGIVLKRKRLRIPGNLNGQSATGFAMCLGMDTHFVTRAIREGRLKASRRETHRTEAQGGDIYYITDEAARRYIIDSIHEIDIRKVDKYWIVDLLANGA